MSVIDFVKRKLRIDPYFRITEGKDSVSGIRLNDGNLILKVSIVGYNLITLQISKVNAERLRDWFSRNYPRSIDNVVRRLEKKLPVSSSKDDPDGSPPNAG